MAAKKPEPVLTIQNCNFTATPPPMGLHERDVMIALACACEENAKAIAKVCSTLQPIINAPMLHIERK